MMTRAIKRKLVKAKITLNLTIQKILDINQSRKRFAYLQRRTEAEKNLSEELKLLNKIAAQQARLIQHYESTLSGSR